MIDRSDKPAQFKTDNVATCSAAFLRHASQSLLYVLVALEHRAVVYFVCFVFLFFNAE